MDIGTYCFAALRWACTSFSRRLIFMRVSSECLRPSALPCIAYRVPVRVPKMSFHQSGIKGLNLHSISFQPGTWCLLTRDWSIGPSCLPRLCLSPSRA